MITAKRFLQQTRIITERISDKQEAMRRYREQAERMAAACTGMPGGGERKSRMAEMVECYVDLEAECAAEVERLREIQKKTWWMLEEMEDERGKQIIEERYILGYTWPAIARHVYCSCDHVFKLHRAALAEFQKIFEKWEC